MDNISSKSDNLPQASRYLKHVSGMVAAMRSQLIIPVLEGVSVILWCLTLLTSTDVFPSFYVVCSLMSFAGICCRGQCIDGCRSAAYALFACAFAMVAIVANYAYISGLLRRVILFFFGTIVGLNILRAFVELRGRILGCAGAVARRAFAPCFLAPFLILFIVYVLVLTLWLYPGVLTPDSIDQIEQSITGSYTNHHPFWHTIVVGWIARIGADLLGNINIGVALYAVFQCAFMAASFSYATLTMGEAGLPRWTVVICVAVFALLPYHFVYASTIWKNIPFSGCVLLFSLSLFRVSSGVGMQGREAIASWAILVLGALGLALLQHNGWFALLLATPVVVWCSKNRRWMATICVAVLVISLAMQQIMLPALDVAPVAGRESLSIPAQQIARAVTDDGCGEREREALAPFVDPDELPVLYKPYISDPVKWALDEEYYSAHKGEFFALWFSMGLAHPIAYVRAWIDETKGYWFGGYDYWLISTGVRGNDFGICRRETSSLPIPFRKWTDVFLREPAFQPLRSIGLASWSLLGIAFASVITRSRAQLLIVTPALCVVATLLISTPVYCEFRYAYSLFAVLPPALFLYSCSLDFVASNG